MSTEKQIAAYAKVMRESARSIAISMRDFSERVALAMRRLAEASERATYDIGNAVLAGHYDESPPRCWRRAIRAVALRRPGCALWWWALRRERHALERVREEYMLGKPPIWRGDS